ncbi:MAG TPA: glycerol-3-phosphate 1-O-acyltransferase PlsB [Xanthomonadaceae bacterium]|nr:glycerol-3-phosphate 1-O-acyltransferase PlsB [Xanthomonadaceae bacterium]
MSASPKTSAQPRPSWPLRVLGWLLEPWIRIRLDPERPTTRIDGERPVCYVIERYGLSNALILDRACRQAGLPSALVAMPGGYLSRRRALLAVSRRPGFWFRRPSIRSYSQGLAELLEATAADAALDIQLVPVSIFVGRAPTRSSGWFSVLFSENWAVVGRFRRFMAIVLNGRDTYVQFSAPVSLRQALAEDLPRERAQRRLARVLRTHFRRIRGTVIGPDLSHRRMLIDEVLNAEPVRMAIEQQAARNGKNFKHAYGQARAFAWEIAADYSHTVVRSASFLLTGFWNKIFDGLRVHHFDTVKDVAPGREVIYVPCHRSHIDYLLISYILYTRGLVPPHIAAGVNLNMPLVGPILRRGGAFFLRRSFKSNALYSAVFSEYVAALVRRGVSLEYFIEGGRSRTGRLLQPKAGMLGITVRGYLRQTRRPVVFQPVYIGYEKLIEGRSYIGELSGKPKQKESLFGLLRAFGVLRHNYGQVTVNFGEPIHLDQLLDETAPGWRESPTGGDSRPSWLNPSIDLLAWRILARVNEAANLSPVNLLALALLSTPKKAMTEIDLVGHLDLLQDLFTALPYSARVTVTEHSPAEIIAYGEKIKLIQRVAHPLGDVLNLAEREAILASYYRNNVQHLLAAAAWVACCFSNNRRMSRAAVLRLGRIVYPYIQAELFLPWSETEWNGRVQATIEFFLARGLLFANSDGRVLSREAGQSDGAYRLRLIAHSLLQAFERYYIAIAVLVKNGPGTLSAAEVENLCHLTAQRLTLVYELNAPEYFDKALFRSFIAKLRERGVVKNDEAGKLRFEENLVQVSQDAKVILRRELRHSILKLSPEARASLGESQEPAK